MLKPAPKGRGRGRRAGPGSRVPKPMRTAPTRPEPSGHEGAPAADRSPTVSVVVPSYNYARFIEQALRSVIEQTYPDIELVVVDDRSSDDSVAVVKQFMSEPTTRSRLAGRMKLVAKRTNEGAHVTLNQAIAATTGRYVAILNADDLFGPRRIETMIGALQAKGGRIGFSRIRCIDELGRDITRSSWEALRLIHTQDVIPRFPSLGFACLPHNVAISTGNLIFERALYDEVGPFSDLRYCHDWDFLLRAVLVSEPVYVDEPEYSYRLHGTNTFMSLGHLREQETEHVLTDFLRSVRRGNFGNSLCPSPECWPYVFERVLEVYGLWGFWNATMRS